MLETLPWWALILIGAAALLLVWLLVGLTISRPRRHLLENRADELRQQIEHLNTQRTDREARVGVLEARLAESEHLRLHAETRLAERDAELAQKQTALSEVERLHAEIALLEERVTRYEEDLQRSRERALTLEAQRDELLSERDDARAQVATVQASREALHIELERLRGQLAETRYASELHAARLRVAEGEHEANALAALRSRQLRNRDADVLALSTFAHELADYRIALRQARHRLNQLQQNAGSLAEDTASAAAIAADLTVRSSDLRDRAAQFQLIDAPQELQLGDTLEISADEADEQGTSSLARDLIGYLRDTFGRLPFRVAPPLQPPADPNDAEPQPGEPAPRPGAIRPTHSEE